MPVTSLVIPVRNGERFIADALASAAPQLQSDDEIFIVDDGSTDNTLAVVERIKDPRIKVLPGLAKGVSSARNIGINHATGEFICFLDHDDIWPEGRHKTLLKYLQNHPDYDAVYGRIHLVFEADAPGALKFDSLEGQHTFALITTALFRRDFIIRAGRFAEDMHFGEDTDFSIRLLEQGMRASRVDLVSLIYRRHASNASNDVRKVRDGNSETIIRKLRRSRLRNVSK